MKIEWCCVFVDVCVLLANFGEEHSYRFVFDRRTGAFCDSIYSKPLTEEEDQELRFAVLQYLATL